MSSLSARLLISVSVLMLFFFGVKTLAGAMGSSGYLLSPAMAAWIPLLVFGPMAYSRLREVQTV